MAMKKKILKAVAISPIFSHREKQELELRATEWKALMRTVFRWSYLEEKTTELYKKETEYFGGPSGERGYASPIRLQVVGNDIKSAKGYLVDRQSKRAGDFPCYPAGTEFNIVFRKYLAQGQSLEWYENMLKLSVVLSGVGKRSRRGRGAITLDGMPETKDELLHWLVEQLNMLNERKSYQLQSNRIENMSPFHNFNRPVIEKVIIGNEIEEISAYLSSVDNAAHHTKELRNEVFLSGYAKGRKRFASALIVSIVETKDGRKYPIYTLLKPAFQRTVRLPKNDDRQKFLRRLEG